MNDREKLLKFLSKYFTCPITAVEVGVWLGEFSQAILDNLDIKKIYLIDPWKIHKHIDKIYYINRADTANNQIEMDRLYHNTIKRFKGNNKVQIYRKSSVEASKLFVDGSLDFVYIDGCHDYNFVFDDLNHWSKKINNKGLLICDDYIWGNEQTGKSVQNAIKSFLKTSQFAKFKHFNSQFVIRRHNG